MTRLFDVIGYVAVASMFVFSLGIAAAAHGEGIHEEKPSQFIWQTKDGTYTNLPMRHGDQVVKQFTPSRDRITPVKRTAAPHFYAVPKSQPRYVAVDGGGDYCREVYLGGSTAGGGATICGGERAVISEERVRPRGSLTTTHDTVLRVDGEELLRIEGRQYHSRTTGRRR